MSWSFSVGPIDPGEFLAALGSAEPVGNADASEERQEQVQIAKAAVTMIFDSGAIGNAVQSQPGTRLGCTCSGHAQPDHVLGSSPADFQSESVVISFYRMIHAIPAAPVVEQPVATAAAVATPEPVAEVSGPPQGPDESNDPDDTGSDSGEEEPTTEPAAETSPVVTGGLSQ